MKPKVRKLSIRWKILIPATIMIIVMCAVIGVNSYLRIKTGMIQLGVEEAQMAATIAGFVVDGDSLSHVGTGFENTQEYQDNLTALRQIQSLCGIAYLYTLHTDDNARLYYGIDTDDSAGKVVAVLGCDYDASYVLDRIEGDLTQKLDIASGDELELISGNVNTLLEYIRGIMLHISSNSTELGTSTGTIAESLVSAKDNISDISASMEEMSAAMEETSASLSQIDESVLHIMDSIGNISAKASSERDSASEITEKVQTIYESAQRDRADAARQAAEMSKSMSERIERSKAVEHIDTLTAENLFL